jgi:signal transduction histidine kinase
VAPLALASGYQFDFDAEPGVVAIEGAPHAIKRAVNNLLGNAVAHGGGSGLIRVRVSPDGVVEVSDQGPGVAPAERDRVFDPFHRERWDKDGCGLGLHLVSEIMRAHGGRAELDEAEGGGARFRLRFPLTSGRPRSVRLG